MDEKPIPVVVKFNEFINTRDIKGLESLMTDDHTFIDSSNGKHSGKKFMVKSWLEFFQLYPDYRNHFTKFESRKNLVLIIGHSSCSYKPLDGPAIWTARIEGDLVAEWRVYLDTRENRDSLGLE